MPWILAVYPDNGRGVSAFLEDLRTTRPSYRYAHARRLPNGSIEAVLELDNDVEPPTIHASIPVWTSTEPGPLEPADPTSKISWRARQQVPAVVDGLISEFLEPRDMWNFSYVACKMNPKVLGRHLAKLYGDACWRVACPGVRQEDKTLFSFFPGGGDFILHDDAFFRYARGIPLDLRRLRLQYLRYGRVPQRIGITTPIPTPLLHIRIDFSHYDD
jgi:hypothetical protein